MPGRSAPRRPVGAAQGTHLHGAFSGALDGASTLPAPVGEESREGTGKKSPVVYFHQDRFTMSGGFQKLSLTYVPIANSEHAYKLQGGASGHGLLQNAAWRSTGDGRTIEVLTGANTAPGDVVVVEYAYYEQVPGTPSKDPLCIGAPRYPNIVAPSAPSYTSVPGPPGPSTDSNIYLPAADGFPVVPSPTAPGTIYATDAWGAYWSLSFLSGTGGKPWTVDVGPGIAPGSSGSRRVNEPQGETYRAHIPWLRIYSGTSEPRWEGATTLGASTYYAWTGNDQRDYQTAGTDFPVSRGVSIGMSMFWLANRIHGFDIYLEQHEHVPGAWSFNYSVSTPGNYNPGSYTKVPIPVNLGSSWTPGPHFIGIELDMLTSTLTGYFDGASYSMTDPAFCPTKADFAQQRMIKTATGPDIEAHLVPRIQGQTTAVPLTKSFDRMRIDTDVPYCVW